MNHFQSFLKEKAWYTETGPHQDVVCSSRARLSRNLSGFFFPYKLSERELQDVQSSLERVFQRIHSRDKLTVIPLEQLSVIDRRRLIEKRFISQEYSLEKERIVAYDQDNSTVVVVNDQDHLRISSFAGGFDLIKAFERAEALEHELEEHVDFAVSLDKGYLSADIKNCGTGLRASVMLHLPGLEYSGLLDRSFKKVMDAGYEVKGFTGEEEGSMGSLYQLYNPVSIGENEKDLLEKLAHIASLLVNYERRAREEMKRHRRLELEDMVFRAWGTLSHCRLLEEKEAQRMLSHVRLGAALGMLDVPLGMVQRLVVLVGKAHIQHMLHRDNMEETSQQLRMVRANLVKHALGFAS